MRGESRSVVIGSAAHLVQHTLNKLDLVRDLCAAKDSQKRPLRVLEDLCKELEFLLHQETSRTLLQLHANHARVRTVRSAKRVIDVHIAEPGERITERLEGGGIGLDLVALLILDGALLLDVEPQVLEEDDGPGGSRRDARFDLRADAVVEEDDVARELGLELLCDGLERVLCYDFAIWAAEVGHEDDGGSLCGLFRLVRRVGRVLSTRTVF